MTARFWYRANELPENRGTQVYLVVSPGHYGTGLSDVHDNIGLIKSQLEKGQITYDAKKARENPDWIRLQEIEEPQIEFGDTDFDKRIMRTKLNAETTATKTQLEERFKTADFYPNIPASF